MSPEEFAQLQSGDQVVSPSGHVGTVIQAWSSDIVTVLAVSGYSQKQLEDWSVIPRLYASTSQRPRQMVLTWQQQDGREGFVK